MVTEKDLVKKLRAFIKDKRKPVGNVWPEVKASKEGEPGDVSNLYEIFMILLI